MTVFEWTVLFYLIIAGFFMNAFENHVAKYGRKFHPFIIFITGLGWPAIVLGAITLRLKKRQY